MSLEGFCSVLEAATTVTCEWMRFCLDDLAAPQALVRGDAFGVVLVLNIYPMRHREYSGLTA